MFAQTRFLRLLLTLLAPAFACAQNVPLTFRVDMRQQNISPLGVHIAGDFQSPAGLGSNWNPGSTPMTDGNGDGIYELTVQVPQGAYFYKFVNGNAWGMDENPPSTCSVGSTNNRVVTAGPAGADLPPVLFNGCNATAPPDTNYALYWWNDAVFYEIFVRSFYDSNGDGIGDFRGIIEKLDYLNDGNPNTNTDLGVTGIWLMPMMTSPSYHGYDVTNYYQVEPDYGSMADFEAFLDAAHDRGIKVIIDFVMNHTSSQHPWFTQSANNQNGYRDWYVWSNTNPGFPGPWGQQVWHSNNNQYYYGIFWGGMPDLNYSHPPVKAEMFNITNFWLDKGVDGFRLDAIKYLDEDGAVLENTPETFALLEAFNDVYKSNNPDAFTVGEVWSNTASILPYVYNDRLDVCFDFDLAYAIIGAVNNNNPASIRQQLQVAEQGYPRLQYATFLTNHDIDRIFSQFGSNTDKMKQAAAMYLTMPGIPFVYYGEEIGLIGTGVDENKRRPMHWTGGQYAGFSTTTPWASPAGNLLTNNVATMTGNPNSLLSYYRDLIHLRNDHAPLRRGYLLPVESSDPNVLMYARIYGNEAVIVQTNFGVASASPTAQLSSSTLADGVYVVTDLFTKTVLGTLTISSGGFSVWPSGGAPIASRETRLYGLSPVTSALFNPMDARGIPVYVYPNPAGQEVFVQLEDDGLAGEKTILVSDATGKVVYQGRFAGNQVRLDTGTWLPGVYAVQISGAQHSGMARFIKW
ncbi:MAG: alpha-amylase family glycosyl hydrolase [Saprospiraceae bacterium]|nr:alpha-amylase family glycosyl hydrolase [Saprospiraceae bacterium]